MGSFTGDMLRILASGGMKLGTELLGEALTIPMRTKAQAKLLSSKSILENLPMMSQDDAAAAAGILNKIAGTQVVPTRMAETGNVVGPTGEALAMTPMPGAPVSPEIKEQFVTGTPTLDQLKSRAFGSMSLEEQKRHMKAIDTLGQLAAYENAVTAKKRYDAMYAPGGTEWRKVEVAESKVPIAQQQADASTLGAVTGEKRLGLDTRKLEEVDLPATKSLIKYRGDLTTAEKAAMDAKTAEERHKRGLALFNTAEKLLAEARQTEESLRKRNLKKPADFDALVQQAEKMRRDALKLTDQGWHELTPEQQKAASNPQRERDIEAMKERAAAGDPVAIDTLQKLGIQ